jgi:hypothetical protein
MNAYPNIKRQTEPSGHLSLGFVITILISLFTLTGTAWGNSCYSKALPFQSVPPDRSSTVKLEARRVVSTAGKTMVYDLGGKTIRITADSFGAKYFIKDVSAGRCAAHETVKLTPERKSPFNTHFKAGNRQRE